MSHSLHSLTYKDLFSGHTAGKSYVLKTSSDKRLIIISDCHLDEKFNRDVYKKLQKIIDRADILVINGDFWADSFVTFDKFVKSRWSSLFPSLQKKNTYYVFGNHDMPVLSDKRIYEFCGWAGFRLKITAGNIKLHVEHGHLLSKYIVRNLLMTFERYPRALKYASMPYGIVELIARYFAKKTNSDMLKHLNFEFKGSRYAVSTPEEYFVMGHTHVPEFDVNKKYINTGRTHDGHFDYVEVYRNVITVSSL